MVTVRPYRPPSEGPLRGFFIFVFYFASMGQGGVVTVVVVDRTQNNRTPNIPLRSFGKGKPGFSVVVPCFFSRRVSACFLAYSYGCCAPQQVLGPRLESHLCKLSVEPPMSGGSELVLGEAAADSVELSLVRVERVAGEHGVGQSISYSFADVSRGRPVAHLIMKE
ncbi:hypothetical protein BJY52DRAFT_1258734 [Lactarius psammicola]|nr:hypothetical protein BJY52DRAFT_1258734 [Lactarius psammicola]